MKPRCDISGEYLEQQYDEIHPVRSIWPDARLVVAHSLGGAETTRQRERTGSYRKEEPRACLKNSWPKGVCSDKTELKGKQSKTHRHTERRVITRNA